MAEKSIEYDGVRYRISIPWKENVMTLPNNFKMAEKRLQNLEKRLVKEPKVAQEYERIIAQHTEKGFVVKLPPSAGHEQIKWYLPHFPVVKKDHSTTKIQIVFDASAKYNGIALNDVIYQGPKLQNDLFSVL